MTTTTNSGNHSVASSFDVQQAQHAKKVVASALREAGLKCEDVDIQRVLRSQAAPDKLLGAKMSASTRLNLQVFFDQFRLPGAAPSALDMRKLSAIAI